MKSRGFIVHSNADMRKDRLFFVGRLEDGKSFAAVESKWKPSFNIYKKDIDRLRERLSFLKEGLYTIENSPLESFEGNEELLTVKFTRFMDFNRGVRNLESSEIISPDMDLKIPEIYLIQNLIKGHVELDGHTREGKLVDLVFPEPKIIPVEKTKTKLKIASIDIETDVEKGIILAISISCEDTGMVRVIHSGAASPDEKIIYHSNERDLLSSFLEDVRKYDPDVITGWNFLDFDFPILAERSSFHKIPFLMGRSEEESVFFSAYTETGEKGRRQRSAAGIVQGRQILDALRIYRSGPHAKGNESNSLEAVGRKILGEGKLIGSQGRDKISDLKVLYETDPAAFGEYCLRDAELVLAILEKTGLFNLTVERAGLTGVSLDKAWTSVVSFERIYGIELQRRFIAPGNIYTDEDHSGAHGGTVLEPATGLFKNVAVFDYRSLYPSIMQTFNIDPLAMVRAEKSGKNNIIAPNGACFSAERAILGEILGEYFSARKKAIAAGDEEASYVYKILMNSFYGVLGSSSCRYGRSKLAGAITSFARMWLLYARDWFNDSSYNVLYGDTDSLFVESKLKNNSSYRDFNEWGKKCTEEINKNIAEKIRKEYGTESFLELRFEKAYRSFIIPPLRASNSNGMADRGRAKGYSGYLLNPNNELSVEVVGMEAVRSDYTACVRRIQVELLEMVFSGCSEEDYIKKVDAILDNLRNGKLDNELIYRKRLTRAPETYTTMTPPQVKAARLLGWKNRRGVIEYVWTKNGAEPFSPNFNNSDLDYEHYAESQILPAVRSIAAAVGWKIEIYSSKKGKENNYGQLVLF